ncbi:hypothetical protein [Microbacterium trichothecenolyticum]|uniref:Uridine kinase n=1 Tax=Microbacterium trichothecenolyticum TaxID=69370 RepID=A0ABU0TSX5_MICTR|nr:hypothetical protein [Microbacterium trichothecenolyticum]MDQ1122767.1 uridine kinase [Microbacterium trichothecenolyticum]
MSSPENAVRDLQRSLRALMRQNNRAGRVVVAIDALDQGAAREFANGFEEAISDEGTAVFRASLADGAPEARERFIAPFRAGEEFGAGFVAPSDAVLVVDGRFLHSPEVRGLWNFSVWLENNPPIGAPRPELADAEKHYLRTARPRAAASVIVENSDPAHPVQVFGDFC